MKLVSIGHKSVTNVRQPTLGIDIWRRVGRATQTTEGARSGAKAFTTLFASWTVKRYASCVLLMDDEKCHKIGGQPGRDIFTKDDFDLLVKVCAGDGTDEEIAEANKMLSEMKLPDGSDYESLSDSLVKSLRQDMKKHVDGNDR